MSVPPSDPDHQTRDSPYENSLAQPEPLALFPNQDAPFQSSAQPKKQYLEAPVHAPFRPLSPDSFSNLSIDEYQTLHHDPTKHNPSSISNTWKGKVKTFWTRNLGLFYMLLAQIFGTGMNVATRILEVEGNHGKGFHPFQVLFARMGITVVLASSYMWYTKTPHFPLGMPEVRLLLVARGMGGFFGVMGMVDSLMYLPMADAVVITFLAPGLSCWACSFLIKEPFTRMEKIGTMVSLIGVIFIARPASLFGSSHVGPTTPAAGNTDSTPSGNQPGHSSASNYDNVTPEQRLAAVGIALVGVLGAVSAFTTIRWIGKRAHPLISVNYFATWCFIVSIVAQLTVPGIGFLLPTTLKDWALLFFLGACGFIMQFLLAAGLSYEKSSRATNVTYTAILFAAFSDHFFFGVSPSAWSVVGSLLILGAAITMAMQKASPKDAQDRQVGDGEEERGLMGAVDDGGDGNRMPIQEVQMRTIR